CCPQRIDSPISFPARSIRNSGSARPGTSSMASRLQGLAKLDRLDPVLAVAERRGAPGQQPHVGLVSFGRYTTPPVARAGLDDDLSRDESVFVRMKEHEADRAAIDRALELDRDRSPGR